MGLGAVDDPEDGEVAEAVIVLIEGVGMGPP